MKVIKIPNPCYGAELISTTEPVNFYGLRLPFKPSVKQLTQYALSQKHTTYKSWKTKNTTFDDEALEKLGGKYPKDQLYPKVRDYREIDRARGTYVDGKGFTVAKDGRVHATFTHNTSTLRFAAENPPIQQIPRSGEQSDGSSETPLYDKIRGLFIASEGHTLLARDFSGIEARLVAYLAGDRDLLRLTGIGNAPHAFVVAQHLKIPFDLGWDDEKIAFTAKSIKAKHNVLYNSCKTALYTSLYLGGPAELVRSYPKLFKTLEEAREIQEIILGSEDKNKVRHGGAFPLIAKWQENTWKEAHRLGYLKCPDGFKHYYWQAGKSVFSKKSNAWVTTIGPEGKSAISMRPQHLGALCMSLTIKGAWDSWLGPFMRLTIHDELFLEVKENEVHEANVELKKIMEQPNRFLPLPKDWGLGENLIIYTEGKAGPKWSSMVKLAV